MKLEHSRIDPSVKARDEAVSRRKFCKLGVVGAALLASLQFGSFATTMLTPSTAQAQNIQVGGTTFGTERIKDTVTELDRKTNKYSRRELANPPGYAYIVKGSGFTMGVGFAADSDYKEMTLLFPKEKDKDPNREGAGTKRINMTDFPSVVKRATNQEFTKMKVIIEETTDEQKGDKIISGYALPVDSNGNFFAKHQGGYLAIGISYYPDRGVAYGAYVLLLEPGVREPIARK